MSTHVAVARDARTRDDAGSGSAGAGTAVLAPQASTAPARARVSGKAPADRALERLWKAYRRDGDDVARNRLVEHYQPFVAEAVRRMAARLPRCVDRGDLATAANVGLMAAIASFDPTRGVKFEAYCELRVRGALLDELRTMDWLPRYWRARLELQKRTLERLRAESDDVPNDEEVARAMDMRVDEYRQIFAAGRLDVPLGGIPESDGGPMLEVVVDTHADAPGEKLSRDEILGLVAQRLTSQEYRLVYLKYWEDLSLREIGEVLHISESRVCKIHMRLLERLKDRFRADEE